MTNKPNQPQDKYVLRLPDGMRDALKAAAEKNNRSMNAEIVARLDAFDYLDDVVRNNKLAKERLLTAGRENKDLRQQIEMAHRVATSAQDINRQLIIVLMEKLGVTDAEIAAITRPELDEMMRTGTGSKSEHGGLLDRLSSARETDERAEPAAANEDGSKRARKRR